MEGPPYHPPVKYSVTIKGHQTSISLEPMFWDLLRRASAEMELSLNELVARIDNERLASPTPSGLAGAIRIWLVARLCREKRSAALHRQ